MFKLFRKKEPKRNYLRSGCVIAKWDSSIAAYRVFFSGDTPFVQHPGHATFVVSREGLHIMKGKERMWLTGTDAVDLIIVFQWIKQELNLKENSIVRI